MDGDGDGDRDLKQDTYRDHGSDGDPLPEPLPDLDPEPIPNIVLHPGDTIARGAHADDLYADTFRLLDRNDHVYAVLDCDRSAHGDGWTINAIRYVADRGRGLLPVRPQPDPYGLTVYDADVRADPEYPTPLTLSVSVTRGNTTNSLTHAHVHQHRDGDDRGYRHHHAHGHAGTGIHWRWDDGEHAGHPHLGDDPDPAA
jgi:hypothetical protein